MAKKNKPKQVPGLYLRSDDIYEKVITINGKRVPFRSKDPNEVWRKMALYEETQEKGPLFSDIADEWFDISCKDWRHGTLSSYRASYKRIINYFKGFHVKEIEAPDIKRFLEQLKLLEYSAKTVSKHLSLISMIFDYAITCPDNWRKDNPAQYVDIPKNLPKSKRKPPTSEQIEKVKKGFDNKYGLLAAFFIYSGARLGEALAVQGRHINNDTIFIDQKIIWPSNAPVIEPYPKTEAGKRDIGMLEPLKAMLPDNLKENEFLFGGSAPWTKSMYNKRWASWCASVGLAHEEVNKEKKKDGTYINRKRLVADITPHQLRHEYASRCFEAGIDEKVAAQMFGHSDSSTMRNIYQHIRSRQISDAVQKMNALEKPNSEN